MRKPSSKIKEDIAKLQEQLKVAETREAERIGRLALKAGLGEIEIEAAARSLTTVQFKAGDVIYRQGDPPKAEGSLHAFNMTKDGGLSVKQRARARARLGGSAHQPSREQGRSNEPHVRHSCPCCVRKCAPPPGPGDI